MEKGLAPQPQPLILDQGPDDNDEANARVLPARPQSACHSRPFLLSELRTRINGLLKKEGLNWHEGITVRHLLSALSEDIGFDRVRMKIQRPLKAMKVATHYGCHALRPGDVTQFDNPLAPTLFEKIVAVTGAEAVEWPLRLDCCGHPLQTLGLTSDWQQIHLSGRLKK
jgi:heterodisulfide reductase subunit B